jgi:hypothetical protein
MSRRITWKNMELDKFWFFVYALILNIINLLFFIFMDGQLNASPTLSVTILSYKKQHTQKKVLHD